MPWCTTIDTQRGTADTQGLTRSHSRRLAAPPSRLARWVRVACFCWLYLPYMCTASVATTPCPSVRLRRELQLAWSSDQACPASWHLERRWGWAYSQTPSVHYLQRFAKTGLPVSNAGMWNCCFEQVAQKLSSIMLSRELLPASQQGGPWKAGGKISSASF